MALSARHDLPFKPWSRRRTYRRGFRPGEGTYVGKGCATVPGRLRSSDEASSYPYCVGC